MPREPRLVVPSLPYLVVARAVSGAFLFYRDEDYESYLSLLRQLARDRLINVYGFCLQREEIRLIVKSGRLPIGRVIQRLHGSHTLRINARIQRHGPLFCGRYQAQAFLESDLCSVVRSVHLWPVRAGFTRRAEGFRFSSHSTYLGYGEYLQDFVQVAPILEEFSASNVNAQRSFAKYVESAALDKDDDGISQRITRNQLEESELLKPRIKKGFLQSLAKRISLLLSVSLANLRGRSRRQDLVMARRLMATIAVLAAERSVTEVAKFLGRDKAQISRLVSQGMDLVEANEPFRVLYDSVWQEKKRNISS